jgi:hypothetical protein
MDCIRVYGAEAVAVQKRFLDYFLRDVGAWTGLLASELGELDCKITHRYPGRLVP